MTQPTLPVRRGDPVVVTVIEGQNRRQLFGVVLARQVRFVKVLVFDPELGVVGEFEERHIRPAWLNRPTASQRKELSDLFEIQGIHVNGSS